VTCTHMPSPLVEILLEARRLNKADICPFFDLIRGPDLLCITAHWVHEPLLFHEKNRQLHIPMHTWPIEA